MWIISRILSILTCCCYGVIGLILGIVVIVLAKKAKEIYLADPELYTGYNNVKTGRILAIIGIVLSAIYVLLIIVTLIFYGGVEGLQEMQDEMIRNMENA